MIPAPVRAAAAGRAVRAVWENELGGITFEVGAGTDRCFVKWAPAASGIDLGEEAARLSWAVSFTPVPRLLSHGADDTGSWIVTAALPGQCAVAGRWKAEPATAVTAIGEGLRAMHEAAATAACPFSWMAEDRLADTRRRASEGRIDPDSWHPVHQPLGIGQALELLADIPSIDRLVICHGDSCAPNTLLTDDGRWSGHVDLGELGVADRVGRPRDRHVEHRVELRAWLGQAPANCIRGAARPGPDPVLPAALGPRSLIRDIPQGRLPNCGDLRTPETRPWPATPVL